VTRRIRSAKLETRSARLRLSIRKKPYAAKITRGVHLLYRRNKTAGTWGVRVTRGGEDWTERLGSADDYDAADGRGILTYDEASTKAKMVANAGKPATDNSVKAALDRYETDLRNRSGELGNAKRVRAYLSERLASKVVATLTHDDLTGFRDTLLANMKHASAKRTVNAFKAALNLAADCDERITRRPWKTALKIDGIDDEARNVILDNSDRRAVILAAHRDSDEFGLLIDVLDETGARPSQVVRLQSEDVQADFIDPKSRKRQPRLMMPVSRKGSGKKKITHRPVPITEALAKRLKGRTGLLLKRADGTPWAEMNLTRCFDEAMEGVTFNNPAKVTMYTLRHTSIVRQLLANVPVRVVAALHDTSVTMIEKNYSRYIADHADELARATLPKTSAEVLSLDDRRASA
jgi:integrase